MDLRWMLRLYPRAWRDRYEDEVSGPAGAARRQPRHALRSLVRRARRPPGPGAPDRGVGPWRRLDSTRSTLQSDGVLGVPAVRPAVRRHHLRRGRRRLGHPPGDRSDRPGGLVGHGERDARSHARDVADQASSWWLPGSGRLDHSVGVLVRAVPFLVPPALCAMGISLHATGRFNGQPLDSVLFMSVVTGLLTLPLVVGRAVARDVLGDRAVYLTQAAAGIVAAGDGRPPERPAGQPGCRERRLAGRELAGPDGRGPAGAAVADRARRARDLPRDRGAPGGARRSERPVRSARGQASRQVEDDLRAEHQVLQSRAARRCRGTPSGPRP